MLQDPGITRMLAPPKKTLMMYHDMLGIVRDMRFFSGCFLAHVIEIVDCYSAADENKDKSMILEL